MDNGDHFLPSGSIDELSKGLKRNHIAIERGLTVLFPTPVGPIILDFEINNDLQRRSR
jgi:hypothetical protein